MAEQGFAAYQRAGEALAAKYQTLEDVERNRAAFDRDVQALHLHIDSIGTAVQVFDNICADVEAATHKDLPQPVQLATVYPLFKWLKGVLHFVANMNEKNIGRNVRLDAF